MKKVLLLFIITFSCLLLTGCNKKNKEQEEFVKAYREAKITLYKEQNELYEDYEVDVAFLGDSLTDGYDLEFYYKDFVVLNRGIGGDTTFDLEKRLDVSLYELKPKIVVMLIGANNFHTMFDNYENILIGFKENVPNTKVILLSLTSMSKEWGKNNQVAAYNNVIIKKLADKYDYEYVDIYSPLLNLETKEIYSEYTTDGGHLTSKGYEVITATLTPVIIKELEEFNKTK